MRNERAVTSKSCRTCGIEKPISEFWRVAKLKDGRDVHCRDCVGARSGVNARRSAMMREKAERRRAGLHLIEQPCRGCLVVKPVSEFAPVRSGVFESYCRSCSRVWGVRNTALRRGAKSISYDANGLAGRAAMFGDACWMCGGSWSAWDHVKPIAKGGIDCLANLRPACSSCNGRKNAKWRGVQWVSELRKQEFSRVA